MRLKILTLIFFFGVILAVSSHIDDEKCEAQLKYFSDSLKTRETWAVEFFDSWTKLQAGISSGNRVDLGHYDQCVEFRHKSDVGEIQGQHCMIFYRASANASNGDENFNWSDIGTEIRARSLTIGGGYCLPATCSIEKFRNLIGEYLAPADLVLTSNFDQSQFCHTNDSIPFETIDIITIIICSILLLLLVSSTIYELIMIKRNQNPHELYSSFSLYKNGKKLFDTSRGKSSSIIHCLPGLRTISMFHIMLGHRYGWSRGFPNINSKDWDSINGKWHRTLWSAVVNLHPIAVDCFFVLGGCLLARSILTAIEKKTFNVPKMYLHRYLRVMPVLAFLILFVLSLFKFMGNGPYYTFTMYGAQISQCQQYWWTALVHIANYYNPLDVCIQPSWYLSVDFQLVLLSPLIMYPAYKWGWKFLWLLPSYVIAIQVWIFSASMMHGYKPVRLLMPYDVGLESAEKFYFPTHIRIGPWLTGVILGYEFYKLKNRKVSVNKHLNAFLWILSLGIILCLLFGLLPLQSVDNPPPQIAHALFFAMQRNCWGIAIGWIIFSCEMGGGGIIKKFLELPLWRPFGRMSLSFYLVHGLYFTVHTGSGRVPFWYSDAQLLHTFAGDIIIVTILASILYLTFEEPFLLVENYIYKAIAKKKSVQVG